MKTRSDAVGGAETATEPLQLELEQLRSELDRCRARLHLTETLLARETSTPEHLVATPILRMVEPVFAPEGRLRLARHFSAG